MPQQFPCNVRHRIGLAIYRCRDTEKKGPPTATYNWFLFVFQRPIILFFENKDDTTLNDRFALGLEVREVGL